MNIQNISQRYFTNFPADTSGSLIQRQTPNVLLSSVQPIGFPNSELIICNQELAKEIGLGEYQKNDDSFLSATDLPSDMKTYATAYAGHQFGNWAGQLGDGRAIYAGEIQNEKGQYTELQWKGAGATPYSRHADGKAVFRSSLREYLMSEAMHHLGIPTTRALSLSFSGEEVIRDVMYNGNPKKEKGAVVMRVAPSFLRFGHFELASAQQNFSLLKSLTDFTIKEYYPEIHFDDNRYKNFFHQVCKNTANLMVEWSRVGFVHGVMNTDNMSILGLTIDYGPFSMLDEYDLNFTPNTTDLPGRRYSFGKQPQIAQWNLWQLANSLYPLIEDEVFLEEKLAFFNTYFWETYDKMMLSKFGIDNLLKEDGVFFEDWQRLMIKLQLDYTLFFHHLEKWRKGEILRINVADVSYATAENQQEELDLFINRYQERINKNQITEWESIDLMKQNNPKFILRNYLLYECIEDVEKGGRKKLDNLLKAIEQPYEEVCLLFSKKRPTIYNKIVGCSMLSCSS